MPSWIADFAGRIGHVYPTPEDRMRLILELAWRNSEDLQGGPFGAAIFECGSGKLVSMGANLVMRRHCSVLHAEIVAIMLAQQRLGAFDLSCQGHPPHELVTSTEPCAMCLGAIPWSGVRRVVCGARDEDARAIGFDEGAKLPDWVAALETRGIAVVRDVLREDAVAVLKEYKRRGGVIYNARTG